MQTKAATTVLLLVYLALFAQLGVITRVFIGKLFDLGCTGEWGPCLEGEHTRNGLRLPQQKKLTLQLQLATAGGIYFKDLPSNMLGSWVIGLFVASTTAGLATDKPLTLLPASHPWQRNFELQIGAAQGGREA